MPRVLLIGIIAATALLTPWCSGASPPYPELNPALGKYQDATNPLFRTAVVDVRNRVKNRFEHHLDVVILPGFSVVGLDSASCLPIQETWYTVYRNYENDPAFGGTEKCGRFTSLGPGENGSFPMLIQYGQSSVKVLSTPAASDGYDVQNLKYFQAVGGNVSLLVYVAYVDCQQCIVFRNSYINDNMST